jgi:hypothetical protein
MEAGELMKKAISFAMCCVCFLFSSCMFSSGTRYYIKVSTDTCDIPAEYWDSFQNTTIEQIKRYVISSNQWEFYTGLIDGIERTYAVHTISGTEHQYAYVAVNFYDYFEEEYKTEDKYTTVVDMTAGEPIQQIEISIHRIVDNGTSINGYYFSNLVLRFGDMFSIQFSETAKETSRTMTPQLLSDVQQIFASWDVQHNELMEDDSIQVQSTPTLEILSNDSVLGSEIAGYAHANGPNTARIIVVDAEDGTLYYDQAKRRDVFALGWSDIPEEQFYYYQDLTIGRPTDGPDEAYVEIQLWVTEDGRPSYCAASTQAHLVFWTR